MRGIIKNKQVHRIKMWKFIPRGLRETLERGLNVRRPDPRVKTETKKYGSCCLLQDIKCLRFDYQQHCDKNENKKRTTTCNDSTWLGAVSCSSALALGWVISQPCFLKKWLLQDHKKPQITRFGDKKLTDLLSVIALAQPPGYRKKEEEQLTVKYCNDKVDGIEFSPAIEFGPKTAQETLDDAVEEFKSVHNKLWAEVENKRGIACINSNRHSEAIIHFSRSFKHGYAPAAYNLAQCFELGMGIKQDFHEAAKWYERAASLGHATAMYNLGVFYAHGWGGLTASSKKARQLFSLAANKGQADAKAALGLTETKTEPPTIKEALKEVYKCDAKDVSNDPNELFDLATKCESSINCKTEDTVTPGLVLQLYKMSSELGHLEAKSRLLVLQAFDSVGLLTEYLCSKKNGDADQVEGFSTVNI